MRPLLHLKVTFTQTLPVNRPLVKNKKIQDPHWVAGFTSAEGSFLISINKNKASKYGLQVQLEFIITQHCKDEQLMVSLTNYLDCGNVYKKRDALDLRITKSLDIDNKIIPFYRQYLLLGDKSKDFDDFCKVAELMKNKAHLTFSPDPPHYPPSGGERRRGWQRARARRRGVRGGVRILLCL